MRHTHGEAARVWLLILACLIVSCVSAHAAEKTYTNSMGMQFVLIPAGAITWEGYVLSTNELGEEEHTVISEHTTTIGKPYYLGTHEVTQEQWQVFMGENPSKFKGPHNPVEQVSWHDTQEFIRRLSEKEGHSRYRLPTEAEWEHAARAGTATGYFFGDSEERLGHTRGIRTIPAGRPTL